MNCTHWYTIAILLMAASASPLSAQTTSYCNGPNCTSNSYQNFASPGYQQPTSSWSSPMTTVSNQAFVQTQSFDASPAVSYHPGNQVVYSSQSVAPSQPSAGYVSAPMSSPCSSSPCSSSSCSNQVVNNGYVAAPVTCSQPIVMHHSAYSAQAVPYSAQAVPYSAQVVQQGTVSNSCCGSINHSQPYGCNQPINYSQPVVQPTYTTQAPLVPTSFVQPTRQYVTTMRPSSYREPNRQYASTQNVGSGGLAQNKAHQAASSGLKGHVGGGLGNARYEGVGWSTASPQSAIQNCCYWGQRPVAQIGVARGNDGWYACVLYQ